MNSKIFMGVRILVGLGMVVFGLNKFLNFMPGPDPATMGADMGTLMGVLMGSPFMSIIAVLEILCGVALLLDKYVPLALIFLVAILFVAFLFHFFYDRANSIGSAVFLVLCLALVYSRKERFASILSA